MVWLWLTSPAGPPEAPANLYRGVRGIGPNVLIDKDGTDLPVLLGGPNLRVPSSSPI